MSRDGVSLASASTDAGDLFGASLAAGTKAASPVLRPHVCFVAMNIYPTLTGSTTVETVGGAEVQQTVLVRALVADGFRVSVLTADHGQPERVECDGVQIYRVPRAGTRGIRGLRFLHPHLTDVVAGLRSIDPDIVYFRIAGFRAAAAAWYARSAAKPFVYACASDLEFLPDAKEPATRRDAFLFRLALRAADGVLVQNVRQQRLLKENFDKDSVLLANCYAEPGAGIGDAGGTVLWVGSIKPLKSPDVFVELARRLPSRMFKMVGGADHQDPRGQAYFLRVKELASTVPNLKFVGYVPYREVGRHFDGASALVNTSPTEGFPNTFLQAWIRGIPTLSFVRPEVIPGRTGTIDCADADELTSRLSKLMDKPDVWQSASQACKAYFDGVHGVNAALTGYRHLFDRLIIERARKR
jgi:glycosyltransferase involved in cell wall biosynthesis